MTTAAKISYGLMTLMLLGVLFFSMGHVVLAALFSFMFMEVFFRAVKWRVPLAAARWIAAIGFIITAALVIFIFLRFIKQTLLTLPNIVEVALPKVMTLAQEHGLELPFANFQDLREFANDKLLANALSITKASTLLTREVFHMIIGVVAAVLFFVAGKPPKYEANLFDAVRRETNLRIRRFVHSFEKVFGAQIIISAINTVLTAIFLYFMALPHFAFLTTMTLIIGIMPIIGNIITNTVIVITALGISLNQAILALAFLVAIHKLEYFLNSKIMGTSVNLPMWQMLIAILIGNTVMGIPGIMLAPAILHYIKSELLCIPWIQPQNPPQPA
ncbi:MAG TPA: AI-2E family transporter [Elusimicrobiales bacterium]|nr:AI-2E family transporter [Elusimicrobiales bacterium]